MTAMGDALAQFTQAHPAQSGILPLSDGRDAFAARVFLVRGARRSLDVQYYIWHDDVTGTLMLEELRQAAERGVRVRLLLDDNGIRDLDATLAALDSHPLIEVRLFNPFSIRKPKALGYLTHFSRANRRMHNKSLTADEQATIVGGRNMGDEYFDAGEGVLFADLDVLVVGEVVPKAAADFNRYWASPSAFEVEGLIPKAPADAVVTFQTKAARLFHTEAAQRYLRSLAKADFIVDWLAGRLEPAWANTALVSDSPLKGLGLAKDQDLLFGKMMAQVGEPLKAFDLVSPYFVPTAQGVKAFAALAASGVKVRVLTNALESTDVAAVHAGYAKWRKPLLAAGVELYEMRRQTAGAKRRKGPGRFGSSGSSLHAKTFAVDGQKMFVGSFNFDPRSARLNTEMGFIIESAELATTLSDKFSTQIPASAYRVQLDPQGRLYWLEHRDEGEVRHDVEPNTSWLKRAMVSLLAYLPIEWLL